MTEWELNLVGLLFDWYNHSWTLQDVSLKIAA